MTEDAAYEMGKAELLDIAQSRSSAKKAFVETCIKALNVYKTHCNDLTSQRVQRIQQISSEFPIAGDALAKLHKIPQPDNGIFVTHGIVFSYKPDPDEITHESTTPLQSDRFPDTQSDDNGKSTAGEPGELVKHNRTPLPTLKAPSVKPTGPGGVSTSRALDTRPTKLCHLKTKQIPIMTATVSKEFYWVFEYRTRRTFGYYIMRCPSEDCSCSVFSKNPLCNGRAEQHLEKCGCPFKDVRDMIKRYARPVITGRSDREVTQLWARKHNSKLLASNETHLEKENFAKA